MQVVLPLEVEKRIGTDESLWQLLEITERMDYSKLYATYGRQAKADEPTPRQMFQLVILGFMTGRYSTRQLESACRHDIRFMYILGGKRVPDHNSFWRFIKRHLQGAVAEALFYQLVRLLKDQGEVDFAHAFIDGTKWEANANRYSFVWAKSTTRYETRLDEKMSALLAGFELEYALCGNPQGPQAWLDALLGIKQARQIQFVYGRGKRKTQLQRDVESLKALLLRKGKYQDYGKAFKGRNSFSKTDRDATFMRLKEDHMKNGQLKPAYNLQLAVEGEYIVGVDISSECSDQTTLLPFLDRMAAGCGQRHECIVADAGYESEENYLGAQARGQLAYIKPQNYEKSKTRKYRTNAYLHENMPYHEATDTYTCPAGHPFVHICEKTRKSKTGYEATLSVYECFACAGCAQKALCTRAQGNRQLALSKSFAAMRAQMRERITSEQGKLLRLNRSIQSEGVFGILKQDYGFRRFLRRGKENVFTEMLLYAMAYNANKLHNKRMRQVTGCTIHALSSA